LVGLPFTPTFIGIVVQPFAQAGSGDGAITGLSFLFIKIAILCNYVRVFLGMHKKPFYLIAFKSS